MTRATVLSAVLSVVCFSADLGAVPCFHPDTGASMGALVADINDSGSVSVADLQCALVILLNPNSQTSPPSCFQLSDISAADFNCDGSVNIVDIQLGVLRTFFGDFPSSTDLDADGCPDLCVTGDVEPTLSLDTSPVTIEFGDPVIELAGTVTHPTVSADALTVTASTSSTGLLPAGSLVVDGPLVDGTFVVSVDYPTDVGTATIVITATDPDGASDVAAVDIEVTAATASTVAMAGVTACATTTSGNVVCWGTESGNGSTSGFGQLGNGLPQDETRFSPVPALVPAHAAEVDGGLSSFCALTDSDELYCWGRGSNGTNGPDGGFSGVTPALIPLTGVTSFSRTLPIASAVAGGLGYVWGREDDFDETFGDGPLAPGTNLITAFPVQVAGLSNMTAIDTGSEHVCGVDSGQLYCWGRDLFGAVGQALVGDGAGGALVYPTPQLVAGLTGVVDVVAGNNFTCAIADFPTNNVYCMGSDFVGLLGDGDPHGFGSSSGTPVLALAGPVTQLTEQFISSTDNVCALKEDDVYCWGRNHNNKFGVNGMGSVQSSPLLVVEGGVTHVATSPNAICFVQSGALYCQGAASSAGLLGDGGVSGDTLTPVKVRGFVNP